MNNNCQVSIQCATYNQESYIRNALDSILMQKTDFSFEILLHDDASTDKTTDIVKEYAERFPNIIHLFLEKENKFQKGIDYWKDVVANHSPAKYIAYCEGDDYWTDPYKLQKQYNALETHPECDMCACAAIMVSEDGQLEIGEIRPQKGNGILSMEDTILGGGMYLATNGLFFRSSMSFVPMKFETIRSLDYVTQMRGALRGGIVYIDEKMAAYRRYAKGSYTIELTGSEEKRKKHAETEKEILRCLDEETNHRFHEVIIKRMKDYEKGFYEQLNDKKEEIIDKIGNDHKGVYLWGYGLRGKEFEKFAKDNRIHLDGICDILNQNVGELTVIGNHIFSTSRVLKEADLLLASTTRAYKALCESDYSGDIINLQIFMPTD